MLFKGFLDPQNKFLFYLKKKKPQSSTIHTHTQIHNCWDDMLWYWYIAKVVYYYNYTFFDF